MLNYSVRLSSMRFFDDLNSCTCTSKLAEEITMAFVRIFTPVHAVPFTNRMFVHF